MKQFDATNMEAPKWVEEYLRIFPEGCKDYGTMLGWFANAIMCGYDNYRWKIEKQKCEDCKYFEKGTVGNEEPFCDYTDYYIPPTKDYACKYWVLND